MNTAERISHLPDLPPETPPGEIYRRGHELLIGSVTMACSFSIEDVVVIDLLKEQLGEMSIFAIDTGRLNEETYEAAEHLVQRYGIAIDWYFPRSEAVEQLVGEKGPFSFRESLENRKECCHIRKVEPLQRAINGHAGWVTGMRRGQSVTRKDQQPLEIDEVNGGLLKVNPLTYWTSEQVWAHAEQNRLPINKLHDQGYPSIGCAPCTRPVQPGDDLRAGRWWWESAQHRECGLHRR